MPGIDYGTVRPGTTLYIPFSTFSSNDPQASVTITGLATTDVEIYKDGSVTQRASDAGYTLLDTDGIDFDTTTGVHALSVDLANNTTAGFYASGSQYWIILASITADAGVINPIIATFRIGYPDAILNTTIATLASQTSFTLTSGPAEDDALNGWSCIIHDVASAVQLGAARVLDYTGATKTVTLAAGTTFTAAATDNIALLAPMPLTGTAIEAIEDQWDGTGLTGDPYPSRQDQLNSLGVVSGGFSAPFTGATVTTGTETLTYTSTEEEDGVLHEVAAVAGNTEFYYEIDVGENSTIISVECKFYIQSNGDTVTVKYYDWVSASYKTARVLSGSNGTTLIEDTFVFPINATGTGANIGLGRLQFTSATATNIAVDRGRAVFAERTGGIANGSTVTLSASAANKNLIGNGWTLALGNQDVSNAYVSGASISGIGTTPSGECHFDGCHIDNITIGEAHIDRCNLGGTLTIGTAGDYLIEKPVSDVAGAGSPVLDMNSVIGATAVSIRGLKGSLTVNNLTSDHTLTIGGEELGTVILNGADAAVEIRGIYKGLTNNLTGTPTVNIDGAVKGSDVADILADTNELQADWTNGGRLDLILDAVLAMLDDPRAEPGQGAPAVNADMATKLDYLYKWTRNLKNNDGTTTNFYNDAGTVVDHKQTTSSAAGTVTKTEIISGP